MENIQAKEMDRVTGYIGTYESPDSHGVYRFTMDLVTGRLSRPQLYYEAANVKYISLENGRMAVPLERGGKAGVCLLDAAGEEAVRMDERFCEEKAACHLVQEGSWLYTANYHEGQVMVYKTDGDRLKVHKRIDIAPRAGCHQVILHGRFLLVPCLELDCIRIFDREDGFAPAGEIPFKKGTGPRHGVFDHAHGRLYVVTERSNELYVFRSCQEDKFDLEQALDILPKGAFSEQPPASAAIRLSENGRRIYVSTRFAEQITVFEAEEGGAVKLQQCGCGGKHPRDILLVPNGAGETFLLAVNRSEGGLVSFRVDPESGKLGQLCSRAPAPEGICLTLDLGGAAGR